MKTGTKFAAIALAFSAMLAASAPDAFAWACQAQADDGAQGWSYNYPTKRGARQRALAECNARTYYRCYLVDCQRRG